MRLFLLSFVATFPLAKCTFYPSCESEIYCTGEILKQVQMAKLYDDDKYFVDMKLRDAPEGTLNFSQLREFLNKYFEPPEQEFEPWIPLDWKENPQFLLRIADKELRDWAEKLHNLWKSLGCKIRAGVKEHPELYSLISTPHPVVVPGGRFRELYYWYGFVPNGGRVYYERRSQPPFLTLMVESYYQATKDRSFLRTALPVLEKEYKFWMENRSVVVAVGGNQYLLNRYAVQVAQPRPESYSDDVELAEGLTEEAQQQLYMEMNSGAESGWDFSSRWFLDGQGQNSLKDTRTSHILPVDLNALLCRNEGLLASFHRLVGETTSAEHYEKARGERLKAIEALLWDPERNSWFDYSLVTNTSRTAFHPTNLAPLWAQCYSTPSMGEQALQYLEDSGALKYQNGVPSSMTASGQQWDFPNAWPPLQHMLIEGLSNLNTTKAKEVAFDLAQRWIRTNWLAYVKYGHMYEKYSVEGDGKPGGGGEYEVQLGFGWTNGVAMQLLDQYGDKLSGCTRLSSSFALGLLCIALLTCL
ncbi:Trehalase-like [Scleropages formosus]|uniref:Trehalase n=1 Tax=Scleropages formosus TaxID=113540 RepID=A0A0N8JZC6_SCLFO|nr:Trehalase-like [Scleropages formosus]